MNIEGIRHFIAAMNKQFEQGGIFIERIRIARNETGAVERIYIDYEQRTEAGNETDGNQSTDGDRH